MITKTTTVRGSISGKDDLVIEGTVEGSVRIEGALSVGQDAALKADVNATSITLDGSIEGSVTSETTTVLSADAVLTGSLHTTRLSVAEGAKIQGRVEMDFDI